MSIVDTSTNCCGVHTQYVLIIFLFFKTVFQRIGKEKVGTIKICEYLSKDSEDDGINDDEEKEEGENDQMNAAMEDDDE